MSMLKHMEKRRRREMCDLRLDNKWETNEIIVK